MIQTTPKSTFQQLFAVTDVTLAAITDVAPTSTEPTGDGVFGLESRDDGVYNAVKLLFWGIGSAGTFTARIWGWHLVKIDGAIKWIPIHLLDVLVTLGTGGGLGASQFMGTTIAASGTPTLEASAYAIESPGSNRAAMLKLDAAGARKIQVQRGTTATATGANGAAAGF